MSGVDQRRVAADEDGLRLDRWFKRHFPQLSFGVVSKLMRTGQVRLDGKRVKPGDRVAAGQTVRVPPLPDQEEKAQPPHQAVPEAEAQRLRAAVLYKDAHVIVLNKPPGLAVQGGSGLSRHLDAMLDALTFEAPSRPKLVHRLDKDTSGLLVLGRTANAAAALAKSFKARTTHKLYWALVKRVPSPAQGKIDLRLDKQPGRGGEKMMVARDGKPAVTLYSVQDKAAQRAAWLALKPVTGRTHQLRAHLAAIGHPIIGDGKYGGEDAFLGGVISKKLHLHARRLRLDHPAGGILDVTAPLPEHMTASWETFGWDPSLTDDPFEELL
ncbi:MAG: RluA family pseudouridine synthase [Rhodothalassiaceae bacterium]